MFSKLNIYLLNTIHMVQQPFTPAGVQAKQTELYALSNNALLTEVNAVRADIRAWLNTNFILDPGQVSYINSMDQNFINYTALTIAFAFQFRLPVTLIAPTPLPPPSISKMVELEQRLFPVFNLASGTAVTGEVIVKLNY